jgi:DNA (cytosine-5)-methyltransferase 1
MGDIVKVCNLFAGIGGNRKLWQDVEVTAVELNPQIAKIYQDFFPDDKVIVGDAHQYLLDHYKEFDFIWSSPPCQKHSRMNLINISKGVSKPSYTDMTLWQEIIFLKSFCETKFAVENVIPYYKPIIHSTVLIGSHLFWTNFRINKIKSHITKIPGFKLANITGRERANSLDILVENWHGFKGKRDQIINNCLEPETGLHILNSARDSFPQPNEGLFAEVIKK